jgi:hypothetical protein
MRDAVDQNIDRAMLSFYMLQQSDNLLGLGHISDEGITLISRAIFFASSSWRECTITLAPSRANARATAKPMLWVEPVTNAILSLSNIAVPPSQICSTLFQTIGRIDSNPRLSGYANLLEFL